MKSRYWAISQSAEDEADVMIFGDITSSPFEEQDTSSYGFARQIQELKTGKINVHINSYGGEVAEGFAIYSTLVNHPAKVVTYCDGFACSAASVVFMAGDERIMGDTSLLMIHNASTIAAGTPEELRKAAENLQTISDTSARAYLSRVNLPPETLRGMMDAETWITPPEAVRWGFATAIAGEPESASPTQSARLAVYRALTAPTAAALDVGALADAIVERLSELPQRIEEPEPALTPFERLRQAFRRKEQ